MLIDRFTQRHLILRIEVNVNPEIWESGDIKKEFLKHLALIHDMEGIEIENLNRGNLTLYGYAKELPENLPRRVFIKRVIGHQVIDAAVVTMEDNLDIVVDGPDKDIVNYVGKLSTDGIEIDGETYDDERFLEGVIKTFQKFGSSYLLIAEN